MALIGSGVATTVGADEVTRADIRRGCEVVFNDCALHHSEAEAKRHGYRDIVAPATMLMTWAKESYWRPGEPVTNSRHTPLMPPTPSTRVPAPGTGLFATGIDCSFHGPVYPGERVTAATRLVSVARKRLRVGDGAFLVLDTTYRTLDGRDLGNDLLTVFRYAPSAPAAAPAVESRDDAGDAGGQPAADCTFHVDLQRLVMAAGVFRDFAPIHHDPAAATVAGASAPFANTPLLLALIESAVRRQIGLSALIERLQLRLLSHVLAGDDLRFDLTVEDQTDRSVRLGIQLTSAQRVCVRATSWIRLDTDEPQRPVIREETLWNSR